MKQFKVLIFILTLAVALTLVFGVAPAVFGKSNKPELEDQVSANTAAIADNAADIAAHAAKSIADDNIVQGQVAAETAARIADDNYLQGLIQQNTDDIGFYNNLLGQSCPDGEFVTDIDQDGFIVCAPVDGAQQNGLLAGFEIVTASEQDTAFSLNAIAECSTGKFAIAGGGNCGTQGSFPIPDLTGFTSSPYPTPSTSPSTEYPTGWIVQCRTQAEASFWARAFAICIDQPISE